MLRISKVFLILVLFIILNLWFTDQNTYASHIENIIDTGTEFLKLGGEEGVRIDEKRLSEISSNIFNIFLAIGIVVLIIVGIFLGIKFITSGIEGQAKVKEMLVPYFVGCIVILGAFTIWKTIVNIGETVIYKEYSRENGNEDANKKIESLKNSNAKLGQLIDEYAYMRLNLSVVSIDSSLREYYLGYQEVIEKELETRLKACCSRNVTNVQQEVIKAMNYYYNLKAGYDMSQYGKATQERFGDWEEWREVRM